MGVSTLAMSAGVAAVEELCEPFLVRAGMVARTPRGRIATAAAWRHLGFTPPAGAPGRPTGYADAAPSINRPRHSSIRVDSRSPARAWHTGSHGSLSPSHAGHGGRFPVLELRNQKKARAKMEDLQSSAVPGTRIQLSCGIYGTVSSDNGGETIDVEIAPGGRHHLEPPGGSRGVHRRHPGVDR